MMSQRKPFLIKDESILLDYSELRDAEHEVGQWVITCIHGKWELLLWGGCAKHRLDGTQSYSSWAEACEELEFWLKEKPVKAKHIAGEHRDLWRQRRDFTAMLADVNEVLR